MGVCVFHINVHTYICMNVFVRAFMHVCEYARISMHACMCMVCNYRYEQYVLCIRIMYMCAYIFAHAMCSGKLIHVHMNYYVCTYMA